MSVFQRAGFSRTILIIILLNLTALISAGNNALAYYAAGNVDLYIRNSLLEDPVHYRNSDNEGLGLTESSVYLNETAPSSLNNAWGESYASLATGTLSASAYAKTISDTGFDTSAVASPSLLDTIYFYVPAGYYASGVKASLIGQVNGTLFASSSGKNARAYVQATFGEGNLYVGEWYDNEDLSFNTSFRMDKTFVAAGTTLYTERVYSISPFAMLNISSGAGYGAEVRSDSVNTVRIGLDVSDERISWNSASGVFLSQSAPVAPEPVSFVLFVAGGGVLAVSRLLKKKK